MMIVSKAKVTLCRCIMWGGLGLAAVGAVLFYAADELVTLSIVLLGGGLVLSLLGAWLMKRLFRCPECKKDVLGSDSGIDLRNSKCPKQCPYCGMEIQMK